MNRIDIKISFKNSTCNRLEFDGEKCSNPSIYIAIVEYYNLTTAQQTKILAKYEKFHSQSKQDSEDKNIFYIPTCLIHKQYLVKDVIKRAHPPEFGTNLENMPVVEIYGIR